MASDYDPLVPPADLSSEASDLEQVRELFSRSADRFLRSPSSWVVWAVVLVAAALLTPRLPSRGPVAVVVVWSVAILVGGVFEGLALMRGGRGGNRSELASWVLRSQGNLSLVAVALSVALIWKGLPGLLPALWLLVLGHSFFAHGGLGFTPFRVAGLIYQAGGLAALLPGIDPLLAFAMGAGSGNLWLAYSVGRRRR
ncbi:MAG: hypothetical protein OES47_02140 [Acidobacteriota bacterium]|nr:hypothetical protein [Acidobacteriota bacterium]